MHFKVFGLYKNKLRYYGYQPFENHISNTNYSITCFSDHVFISSTEVFFYCRSQLLHTVNGVKQNKQGQLRQIPWSLTCIKTKQAVLLHSFCSFDLNKELNMK